MVDFPAYFPYLSNKGFIIFFWATICRKRRENPYRISSRPSWAPRSCVFGEAPTLAARSESIKQLAAHLAQGALHPSQEVVVAGADAVCAVDVIHFEPQLLHLLKVVVQREDLAKDWVQVALDHLRPVQLREERTRPVRFPTPQCQTVSHCDWRKPAACLFIKSESLISPTNIILLS